MNSSGNAYQDMLESIFGKPQTSWDLNSVFKNVEEIRKTVDNIRDFAEKSGVTSFAKIRPVEKAKATLPYNLFEKEEELIYEIAVAGYTKENIKVQLLDGGQLLVQGQKDEDLDADNITDGYRHRGISKRNFTMRFEIPVRSVVLSAKVKHGILTIRLLKPGVAEIEVD